MLNKVKNIISNTDRFLFKKFGSDKSIKLLENIKEARIIFENLNEIGKDAEVRFVGGCVRKALSGEIIDDIDLATSHEPDKVKEKLTNKGIKVIDTGISHGTVTAIINKKKIEITTLRKDISTDGRHANVQYTSNWEQDALRRDFTINAVYADIEGRVFDPLDGINDLKNGRIKFIGIPEERIQEDYLRILRYFRFFTQYSKSDHDPKVIKSIKKNINGLNKIAYERIFSELQKILLLNNLYNLFINKDSSEIILSIFPQFKHFKRLKKINDLDKNFLNKYDTDLIMSLLIIDDSDSYEYFCHKYKTSNNLKNRFQNISKNFKNLKKKSFFTEQNIKKLIYLSGKENVKDLLLFSKITNNSKENLITDKLFKYTETWKVPKFPISGDYLKRYGYESGQALGKKLKLLEEEWIKNDFLLDKELLKKLLKKNNYN
jgi:poly(A) polymerase